MHYIVDGYNVINANDMFSARTLEQRRNKLFDFIINNRPHGSLNNTITVVFDNKTNNPSDGYGYNTSHIGEVEVIFSDGISLADDIIAGIVDCSKNPYEIIVITNDKGIRRRIAPSGAKYESVKDFLNKGFKKKNINKSNKKISIDEKEEIDEELKNLWLKKR